MTHDANFPHDLWVSTFSGGRVSLVHPDPGTIQLRDIARQLSQQCRFNGGTIGFYSVAQHSVHVAEVCQSPVAKLAGLLHDAAEAYLGDLVRPVKDYLRVMAGGPSPYDLLEAKLMLCITHALVTKHVWAPELCNQAEVKQADLVVLATEKRDLVTCGPEWDRPLPPPLVEHIRVWSSAKAERMFLDLYQELVEEIG
jgi:hypothetical protein